MIVKFVATRRRVESISAMMAFIAYGAPLLVAKAEVERAMVGDVGEVEIDVPENADLKKIEAAKLEFETYGFKVLEAA